MPWIGLARLDGRFPEADWDALGSGSWIDENTFVVDFQVIGHFDRGQFRFEFNETGVDVRLSIYGLIERLDAVPAG